MFVGALEIGFSLDRAVIFALWLGEDDSNPFSGRKICCAYIGDLAVNFSFSDVHFLAHLHRGGHRVDRQDVFRIRLLTFAKLFKNNVGSAVLSSPPSSPLRHFSIFFCSCF